MYLSNNHVLTRSYEHCKHQYHSGNTVNIMHTFLQSDATAAKYYLSTEFIRQSDLQVTQPCTTAFPIYLVNCRLYLNKTQSMTATILGQPQFRSGGVATIKGGV